MRPVVLSFVIPVIILAVALFFAVLAAAAPSEPTLVVRYRSENSVYVSGGRAAGLAVGDRLRVGSGADAAELEVTFLAEQSASCRLVSGSSAIHPGDKVLRLAPATRTGLEDAESSPPAPEPPSQPPNQAVSDASVAPRYPPEASDPRPWVRASGGVSMGWARFTDGSASSRDAAQQTTRVDLALREIAGGPYTLRFRGRARQDDRLGEPSARQRRDRIYELSLAYEPRDGSVSAYAGRLGGAPFLGLGELDGALAEFRPGTHLAVGAFAGRKPAREGLALASSGDKYGGFVRLAPASSGDWLLAGVRELAGAEISREYAALEGNWRAGGLWLRERVELDLNRSWRRSLAGRTWQLSDVSLHASYRFSSSAAASLSYDRREAYRTYETRSLPELVFDDLLRQGLRARLEWSRPGGLAMWAGGGVRLRENDARQSFSAFAGARHPAAFGLDLSGEASLFTGLYSEGVLGSVRLDRSLGAHRLGLSAGMSLTRVSLSRLSVATEARSNRWLRAMAYARLPRGAFALADLELARGDDLQGARGSIEAGYRF